VSPEVIENIKEIITREIYPLNNNFFNDIPFETFVGRPTDDPRLIVSTKDGERFGMLADGRIAISLIDDMLNANGRANSHFDSAGSIDGGGVVILNRPDIVTTYLQYVLLHELLHAMFYFYHPFQNMEGSQPSIMNYDHTVSSITDFDKLVIEIMYKRCTGTIAPDNDPSETVDFLPREN
jgi:hypothetical protein